MDCGSEACGSCPPGTLLFGAYGRQTGADTVLCLIWIRQSFAARRFPIPLCTPPASALLVMCSPSNSESWLLAQYGTSDHFLLASSRTTLPTYSSAKPNTRFLLIVWCVAHPACFHRQVVSAHRAWLRALRLAPRCHRRRVRRRSARGGGTCLRGVAGLCARRASNGAAQPACQGGCTERRL